MRLYAEMGTKLRATSALGLHQMAANYAPVPCLFREQETRARDAESFENLRGNNTLNAMFSLGKFILQEWRTVRMPGRISN